MGFKLQRTTKPSCSRKCNRRRQTLKILGLRWDTENDILTFARWESKSVDDGITTKRDILRQSSKVYDPLGIISPITVRSKMLMQHIWEMKVDWDEPLSSDVVSQWRDIQTDTYECTKLEISRCYLNNTLNTDKLHIHIFTDASLKAYGSCAYIVDVDGKQSTLVMAKNKVAPLKKMTIPKLELMASVIGARLLNHLMEHINIEQATLWCDSQIVLNWLKTEKQLPAFVRNRVTEIKQLTSKFKWRYCPTESNPADLLSRGMSADKFKNSQLWMHGPQWITDTSKWPSWISNDQHQILSVSTDDTETVKKDETTKMDDTIGLHRIFNIDQFSYYQKLLRVSAYVLRFIRNCRKDKQSGMLTVSEIQNMSTMLIRNSQHRNYAEIVNDLQAKRTKNSLVKQLKLYLDDESIIRCGGGRINNANTLESAKFPVLLPPKDKLTDLIIIDAHTRNFHCGLESTVTALRQYYWIPTIRRNVKSLLRLCVTCRKVTGRPYPVPDPPPLPADRLREDSPFSVTGVDFAGPLHVRTKEGQTRKVYICLFTCASTRAVHLEIVQDLSQNTFILAFCRFTSRKSLPKVMISDNASTFIAGAKVVEHLTKSSYVTEKLNSYGTTWRFIPKRAPWFGGWWERLIGLTKNCIKRVLGRALVDIETLNTIVTEVESILNDRPLTYVSSDPMDDEPLTPSHLLYGRRIRTLPYNGLKDFTLQQSAKDTTHESVTRKSKLLSQILKHFKKRWKQEYLTSLREHYRYTGRNTQNIKVGDVVQIQDDLSRVNWNLAKIDKLVYGKDGLARSAIIRTKNGVTNRPISKLYPLELNSLEVESRAAQSEAMKKIKTWTNAC